MLILASSSPRRRELLTGLGLPFSVCPAELDESVVSGLSPEKTVTTLASLKAAEVCAKYPSDVVIAADTVVCADGRILGKPDGEDEARRMLTLLSGRTHEVYTGVCVRSPSAQECFAERTGVTFYPLEPETVDGYIRTGEPFDKAGGYGIQGRGAVLVRRIEGDYFNVVGLPVARLCRLLSEKFQIRLF